ncbi:small ribosomal subunit protein uS15m [Monosporozyma servazzii]
MLSTIRSSITKYAFSNGVKAISVRNAGTLQSQKSKAEKFMISQRKRQKNEAIQARLGAALDKVDPVFGREETPFINRIMAEISEPEVLSHGYEPNEVEKLIASVEPTERSQIELSGFNEETFPREDLQTIENRREVILRILNMRNADNKDRIKLATKLAREEFERFPGDTGSSEVQAACLTVRILSIAHHVQENKKDHANTRKLRMLVQQRQSIMKYLKRDNPQRYYWAIEKLGLDDASIVNEFSMDRRYMQEYKFFGDKVLIKDSKKVQAQKKKEIKNQRTMNEATAA